MLTQLRAVNVKSRTIFNIINENCFTFRRSKLTLKQTFNNIK